MPTVVFEINGKQFPLSPTAYTNMVSLRMSVGSSVAGTRDPRDLLRGTVLSGPHAICENLCFLLGNRQDQGNSPLHPIPSATELC